MQRNENGWDGTLAKIREALSMGGTGGKLASHILIDPDSVTYSTITELARKSGVSQSAIVRFCRALGYSGYQEFRIALAKDAVDTFAVELEHIGEDDDIASILQKVTKANLQALHDTTQLVQPAQLEKAVAAIGAAGQISIHATGPTISVAWEAFTRLSRIGLNASMQTDLHTQMTLAGKLKPGDVALGISHSGTSIATIEPLKMARARGATTICITRYAESPLVAVSDITLYAASLNTIYLRGRASRMSMMLLVEAIFVALSRHLGEEDIQASREAIMRLHGVTMRVEDAD